MTDVYTDTYSDTYGSGGGGGGAPDVTTEIVVTIDWDKDGDGDAIDDVTPYVLRTAGLSVRYGRDESTAIAPTVSGTGAFALHNAQVSSNPVDGRLFTPNNTASPFYGKAKPARPVRVIRRIDAVDKVLFDGHTDAQPLNPALDTQEVAVSLVDWLADFRVHNITTPLHRGIRTGDAVHLILDAVGWPDDDRDIDPGATVMPWWWVDNEAAGEALEKLVRSEGVPALLTMSADRKVIFRDRHHRLLNAASLTSQQTWTDTGDGLVMTRGALYSPSWENIVNSGAVDVPVRTGGELAEVWRSETPISLSEDEERLITVTVTDPFYDARTPVAGTDWTAISGTVTASLFRTSGGATTIKLTAEGDIATITDLRLRARPVVTAYSVQVAASDVESVAEYGTRTFPAELPWCNEYDTRAVLSSTIARYAHPRPVITAPFVVGMDSTKFSAAGPGPVGPGDHHLTDARGRR